MNEQPYSPLSRIADSTIVTFPAGAIVGMSRVVASDSWGLIVEATPFHPVNPRWPDQPADTGTVDIGGRSVSVVDCQVGAVQYGTGRLFVGAEVPVTHGAEGWHWVVVHVLAEDPGDLCGAEVVLRVDARRRHDLSVAHTARHLSGLALNATLAPVGTVGMPTDTLGHPNFDALALSSSRLTGSGFQDTYRIRTWSLQDELDDERLESLVNKVGLAVTDRIRRWLYRPAPIRMVAAGPCLADLRSWECDLPQGTARVACGGTRPVDLAWIAGVRVTATLTPDLTGLTLTGVITSRSSASRPRARTSYSGRVVHSGIRAIGH